MISIILHLVKDLNMLFVRNLLKGNFAHVFGDEFMLIPNWDEFIVLQPCAVGYPEQVKGEETSKIDDDKVTEGHISVPLSQVDFILGIADLTGN